MKIRRHWYLIFPVLLFGCTIHVNPPKFNVDPNLIQAMHSETQVRVVVPKNAEKEFQLGYFQRKESPSVFVDLNMMYANAKALMVEQLANHKVPVSEACSKSVKLTITDVQWEHWAGGFSIGAYLDFNIQTGDGYTRHYRVQDGSGSNIHRAVGGTVSRAVERIFQDKNVIAYIEK